MKKIIKANGMSMQNIICNDDYVVCELSIPTVKLQTGDIAIYINDKGELIAHRFICKIRKRFVAVGDNCRHFEQLHMSALRGKALMVVRNGIAYDLTKRTWQRILYTLFLLVSVPIKNVTLYFIMNRSSDKKPINTFAQRVFRVNTTVRERFQHWLMNKYRFKKRKDYYEKR